MGSGSDRSDSDTDSDANHGTLTIRYIHPDGRERFIYTHWPRNPDGPWLAPDEDPHGFRTPNGLVWGHTTGELCFIYREPNRVSIRATYSRSQIKEIGEGYERHHWGGPLVRPRVLRPWPVLKLPKRHPANTDPPIGAIDGGCEEEHSEFKTYTMRWDEFSDDKGKGKGVDVSQRKVPQACSTDPTRPCTGRLLSNDGLNCAKNDDGNVYDYLWCEHFVARLSQEEDPSVLLAQTIDAMAQPRMIADYVGVFMYSGFSGWRKYVSGEKFNIPHPFSDPTFEHYMAAQEESDIKEGGDARGEHETEKYTPCLCLTDEEEEKEEKDGFTPYPCPVHAKSKRKRKGVRAPQKKIFHPCSTDPAKPCTGRLSSNDDLNATNDHGDVYDYLWCEHFVPRLDQEDDPWDSLGKIVQMMARNRMATDGVGVIMIREFDTWCKHIAETAHIPYPFDINHEYLLLHQWAAMQAVDELEQEQSDIKEGGDAKIAPGLFSTKDLPKLEEFIPEGLFPDILLVHDPNKVANHAQSGKEPIKYKRVYPVFERDGSEHTSSSSEALVAQLHLHETNRLGEGHHSYVYRAPLTLPAPLSARSPTGQCTVAAKLAYPRCTAHRLLRNEGKMYNGFPRHLQEDYCGFNIIPTCQYPVPACAVVPKFFGYYLPVGEDGVVAAGGGHEECTEDEPCEVDWASPILLMEECGEPVQPRKFTIDQRTECFSLILRLHKMNIVQGSLHVRNVMIQPGPLTKPPEKRTFQSPSFRIIDFGRGMRYRDVDASRLLAMMEEKKDARAEILIKGPGGL